MPAGGLSLLLGGKRGAAAAAAAAKGAAAASASASNSNAMHTVASPPPTPTQGRRGAAAGERRLSGSGAGSRSRARTAGGSSLTPTAAAARRLAVAARAQSPSPSRARSPLPPPSPSGAAAASSSSSFARPPSSCSAAFARQLADLAILSQSQSQSSQSPQKGGLPPLPPPPGPLPIPILDAPDAGAGFHMGLDLSSSSSSGGGGGLARRTARLQLDPLLRRVSLGVGEEEAMAMAVEEAADEHEGVKGAATKGKEFDAAAAAEWRESLRLAPNPSRLVLKRQKTLDDSFLAPLGSSSPVQPACEWLIPSWCKSYPAYATLAVLVQDAHKGLRCGLPPVPTPPPSCGGSYFLRNPLGRLAGVFKPLDEEAYAAANPAGYISSTGPHSPGPGLGLRAGIPPGEAGIREAAAFILDSSGSGGGAGSRGLAAGVPPTVLARLRCPSRWGPLAKPGSLQLYAPHVGSADDFGPGMFDVGDAHRIMLLDLRILNQDRHAGNILVQDPTGGLSSSLRTSLGAHGSNSGSGRHRLLLPFETAAPIPLGSPRTPPSTPAAGNHPGALQPFNLPQPGHAAASSFSAPKPLPFLPTGAAAAVASLDSPPALRRTHSFGPALETATSTASSSSGGQSMSPSSSATFTFPFPFPHARASPPPGAALRRQHSGVGGSRLRHEATEGDEEEDDDDEMVVDREEGAAVAGGGGGGRLRLVPIDHGFALPHSLRIDEAELCWLHWPQAKQPVSPHLRAAARALDADADVARLKATLGDVAVDGEGLPPHCYLTLRMGTELVRQGIGARGLAPYDLAGLLVRGGAGGSSLLDGSGGGGGGGEPPPPQQQQAPRSKFEGLVDATYAALAAEVKQQQQQQQQQGSGQQQRLLGQERYHARFMALFAEGLRGLLDGVEAAKRRQTMLRSASS